MGALYQFSLNSWETFRACVRFLSTEGHSFYWALLYWSWNSNTLATWCKELIHWKRPWCWESLKAGGEGDNRGWEGWMASLTRWTWVWASSGSWWWTGRPAVLQVMGSQRVGHDWATELNWSYCFKDTAFFLNKLKVCGKCWPSNGQHVLAIKFSF